MTTLHRPCFQKFLDRLNEMEVGKAWRLIHSVVYCGLQGFTDEERGVLVNLANEFYVQMFGKEI